MIPPEIGLRHSWVLQVENIPFHKSTEYLPSYYTPGTHAARIKLAQNFALSAFHSSEDYERDFHQALNASIEAKLELALHTFWSG